MEQELKRVVNPLPQNTVHGTTVKKPTNLPLVDIYCIGAIGLY